MTSDAKIGLLLGLVFIFIIAFIINGLPTFRSERTANELTENMRNSSDARVGIGEAINDLRIGGPRSAQGSSGGVYYPEVPSGPVPAAAQFDEPVGPEMPPGWQPAPERPEPVPSAPVRRQYPKIHVVVEGETISSIAKKYYGAVEGNKQVTIEKIFKANKDKVESADDIRVGQKLLIPLESDTDRIIGFLGDMGERVNNMGGRPVATSVKKPVVKKVVKGKLYTVKDGDSLWNIAAKELGNGNRYVEISKLNAATLGNEDDLTVGMRLKLPSR